MPGASLNNRPYRNYRFRLTIGNEVLHCTEINGLDATFDVVEYREGDFVALTPLKMPGLIKYGNLTLKHGVTSSVLIYEWLDKIRNRAATTGGSETQDITIDLLDDTGEQPAATWKVRNAWPVKYTAPDFNASNSEVAYESLEFAHEGLTREEGHAGQMTGDDTAASAGYIGG